MEMTGCGFLDLLEIEFSEKGPKKVVARMPIRPEITQPFGYVHGGATISLLETVASYGAGYYADLAVERPFGIQCEIRHVKSGESGFVEGVAELDRIEGNKQIWAVTAFDDEGDVMSTGTFVTKVVSLARLEEKARERSEAKALRR